MKYLKILSAILMMGLTISFSDTVISAFMTKEKVEPVEPKIGSGGKIATMHPKMSIYRISKKPIAPDMKPVKTNNALVIYGHRYPIYESGNSQYILKANGFHKLSTISPVESP